MRLHFLPVFFGVLIFGHLDWPVQDDITPVHAWHCARNVNKTMHVQLCLHSGEDCNVSSAITSLPVHISFIFGVHFCFRLIS